MKTQSLEKVTGTSDLYVDLCTGEEGSTWRTKYDVSSEVLREGRGESGGAKR